MSPNVFKLPGGQLNAINFQKMSESSLNKINCIYDHCSRWLNKIDCIYIECERERIMCFLSFLVYTEHNSNCN